MATIIKVEGMTCNHCKMSVEKAALNLESVKEAVVDLDKKELTITFSEAGSAVEDVRAAVKEAGYEPI